MSQPQQTLNPSLLPRLTVAHVLDWLKPPRSEAITRLRINSLGLFTLTILTNLLPLPSPWTAITIVRQNAPISTLYYSLCALEVVALGTLSLNILQASYAIRYPKALPPAPPPPPSPAKVAHASPRQWHLRSMAPAPTPQRQKSFTYAPSPASTPSRTLTYTTPPPVSPAFDSSFTSSLGSVPASPASPLAAYRGRHSVPSGRAFDGSLLSHLARGDEDDDDDDDRALALVIS